MSKRRTVLDSHGIEHPDPTPIEIPTRLRVPQRQVDRIREMIRQEMSQAAAASGVETFEEADDFYMEDVEFSSPYEEVFEPLTSPDDGGKVDVRGNSPTLTKEKDDAGSGKGVEGEREGTGVAEDGSGMPAGDGKTRGKRGKKSPDPGDSR